MWKVAAVMEAHPVIRDPVGTRKTPLLIINSKIIKEDLKQLGITSNKSYTVPFPDVPEQYLPAFIRGVIDGDGWVDREGYSLNITTASFKFAMGIMKTFERWNINPFLQTTKSTSSQKNIYRVWVKGKQQVLTLAQIIYLNSDSNYIAYKKSRMFFHSDPNNLKLLGKFQTAQGRIRFRTTISIERLEPVKQLAIKQNVPINPKDRIHFKTTYQKSLLEELRVLAKSRGLYINDLIEYSLKFLGDRGK
ncbi:LAGLIDADG family homing endonuclease [Sporosarcina sp. OR05]|uniref:LAGLIDADG family homing endonuclease n=1 Tax=Sporosarcina sp. OR05 TaxID=2969819 RepID=UPI00352AB5D7